MAFFIMEASARDSYQEIITGPTYTKARKALEKLEKTDEDGLESLIRFIGENDSLRIFTIHRLVSIRCSRYLPKNESELCGKATLRMLEILDFDIRFLKTYSARETIPAFVFVAFHKSLIELLNEERTGDYLALVAQKFETQARSSLELFNLWELTLDFYQGDTQKALSILAILFQDTSAAQIHLEYLARRNVEGSRFFEPNVSRLARVIELMVRSQEEQPEIFNEVAYPHGFSQQFNNNIYHFYVPWYLTVKLKEAGITDRYAGIAPFMLTSTYEFITSQKDFTYLFVDPAHLTQSWIIKDIYAGFVAAQLGLGMGRSHRSANQVQDLFSTSTKLAMKTILGDF